MIIFRIIRQIILVAPLLSWATIYEKNHLKAVDSHSPQIIQEKSTGVCSIGTNQGGFGGCTGFRISDDLVMTNFHCLPSIHQNGQGNRRVPRSTKSPFITNDLDYLNSHQDNFGNVNFQVLESKNDQIQSQEERINFFSATAVKIDEIVAINKELDFAIIRITGLSDEYTFTLSTKFYHPSTKLTTIGHPGDSPFPKMKVYDFSHNCRIFTIIGDDGERKNVFGHQCDSNGGSSGSAIIHKKSGEVIGLHFGGGAKEEDRINREHRLTFNKAIIMREILQFIEQNHPFIYDKLKIN